MEIIVSQYAGKFNSDSDAIDHCLSLFEEGQENTLVFSDKTWMIDRAILIPSNTTVIIDDCMIKQKDETFDNIFRGTNVEFGDDPCFATKISPISNVKILGKGKAVLEGPDRNKTMFHPVLKEEQEMVGDFYSFRTHQISFTMISGFELGGVSITKARGWAMSFDVSNNIYIHDIHFNSNVKNGDGIDFRSGTHDCLVERITGHTSDDTVACTALSNGKKMGDNAFPRGNYLYPSEPSACVMEERTQDEMDIYNVTIRDVCTTGRHHEIICLAGNGSRVYDVKIENITEPEYDEWREAVVKIYAGEGYGTGYVAGDMHDISVKNVQASYADNAVYCNAEVVNLVLENINHKNEDQKIKLNYPDNVTIR